MKPHLSIIIPSYNELDNFQKGSLKKVSDYLNTQKFSWEVIIVDDGSADGSTKLITNFCNQHPGFTLVKNPHMGKAATVATGVKKASGKYLLFTDFDQATPLQEWQKLEPHLLKGSQIVIGSREIKGSKREKEPFYRHLMGRGFNWGVQLIALRGIADTQCGFKAFKAQAAKTLFSKLIIYKPKPLKSAYLGAFDVELLYIAKKLNYKIVEVPIHWHHIETQRLSPVRDSIRMAWDVVKIRWHDLLGEYH